MTEVADSWAELPCGSVVVRELPDRDWTVSWYPKEGDPNYPGFTLLLSQQGVSIAGGPQEVVAWAKAQEWTRYCGGEAGVVTGVGVPSGEEIHLPTDATLLDVPVEEWADLRQKYGQFGWLIACTREPDGSFSWTVYDPERSKVMQSGIADDWDATRLDMIENLHPPSVEGLSR